MRNWTFTAVLVLATCLSGFAATRDEVVDLVLNQVIATSPHAAKLAGYAMQKPTPAGANVGVFLSEDLVTLDADSWVVWLDYAPIGWFEHDCALVLVNDADLTYTVVDVSWYPVVEGVTLYGSFAERVSSPDLFYGNPNPPPLAPVTIESEGPYTFKLLGGTHAVIATGPANHPASNADQAAMEKALTSGPPAPGVPKGNVSKPKGSKQALCDALDALPKDLDKLFFHFTGHGNSGAVYFGDPAQAPGMTWSELKDKLAATGAKEFCVTIEACKSGGGKGTLDDLPGSGVTSTDSTHNACFQRSGSNFTQAFAGCLQSAGADANKDGKVSYGEAKDWAKAESAKARGQNPQSWGVAGHNETSIIFPWISYSASHQSSILLHNPSETVAEIGLIAHRADGAYASASVEVPPRGMFQGTPEQLFGTIPRGTGLCVLAESNTAGITGTWVTRSTTNPDLTTARGRAIDVSPRLNCQPEVSRSMMFSAVPDTANHYSVLVLVNVSPAPTNVMLDVIGSDGQSLGDDAIWLPPMLPVTVSVADLVTPGGGTLHISATADNSPIGGAVFMFDQTGHALTDNAAPQP